MSEPEHIDPTDADALLRAMGRALRTPHATSAIDAAPTNASDDDALVASISQSVLAAQRQAPSNSQGAAPQTTRQAAGKRRTWWVGIAAAASLALAWVLSPTPFDAVPLPTYAAEISGIDRDLRNVAPSGPPHWEGRATLGNRLLVTLRPEIASESAVVARLWHAAGDDIEVLHVPMQHSSAGTVRLDAVLGNELALTPGTHRLWLVVARDEVTPSASELMAITHISAQRDRYVLPITLEVRAR